jgi:inward rectifier potassium channel
MPLKKSAKYRSHSAMPGQEDTSKDLGFGSKITSESTRLINKDGTFNVRREGDSFLDNVNWYHRMITIGWLPFFSIIFVFYFCLNLVFAVLYVLIGVEYLQGIDTSHKIPMFWEAFFFSAQTLTTVGYGRISPTGFSANILASFEAILGLMLIALATGLFYGRFSRSVPRIRFSKNILISPYLDINGLMFRIIHERENELIDVNIEVTLSCLEMLPNGSKIRKYHLLDLERQQVNFFPLNWTIVHPITEESPLYDSSLKKLIETDAEFLILLRAIDETFMQQVHVRYSYHFDEVVWGASFSPMFNSSTRGKIGVKISDLDQYSLATLNS